MSTIIDQVRTQVVLTNSLFSEYVKLADSSAIALHHSYRLLEGSEGLLSFGWKRSFESLLSTQREVLVAVATKDAADFKSACAALKSVQSSLARLTEQEKARIEKEKALVEADLLEKAKALIDIFG